VRHTARQEVRHVPRQGPTIAETALALIRERGPQTLDQLVGPIVAAGLTRAKNPRNAVRNAIDIKAEFLRGYDDRWYSTAAQLEGATFTVRLTGFEREDGIVLVREDLALVEQFVLGGRPFAGGGEVHLDFLGEWFDLPWWDELEGVPVRETIGDQASDALLGLLVELGLEPGDEDAMLREAVYETRGTRLIHGPSGWLPALGPRQLLGLTVRGGALGTVALDRRAVNGIHVEIAANRVVQIAQRLIGPDPSWFGPPVVSLRELLEIVVTDAPEVFRRPLPPFTDVVRRGGLEVEDGLVGHAGTDWAQVRWAESPDPEDAWGFEPPDVVH
jgi:hypothetical protein